MGSVLRYVIPKEKYLLIHLAKKQLRVIHIKIVNFSWKVITNSNINIIIMEEKTSPNELSISQEEINALISCPPDVRYQYAIKRIADTETMWTLSVDGQMFAVQKIGDNLLFPIWSSKEYTVAFGSAFMEEYSCIPISLEDFEEYIIDIICENGYLINVFPTHKAEVGKIVGLDIFSEDLSNALSEYN